MPENRQAVGQGDLAAVGVAGEVKVGLQLGDLGQNIGVVAEDNSQGGGVFLGEAVDPGQVQIQAIHAGQADQFDGGGAGFHDQPPMIDEGNSASGKRRADQVAVVVAEHRERA